LDAASIPQALLFDSQPNEVRDDLKAVGIQLLRRASAHTYLASNVRMLERGLEEISDAGSRQNLATKRMNRERRKQNDGHSQGNR
jgi:hypothetical protein